MSHKDQYGGSPKDPGITTDTEYIPKGQENYRGHGFLADAKEGGLSTPYKPADLNGEDFSVVKRGITPPQTHGKPIVSDRPAPYFGTQPAPWMGTPGLIGSGMQSGKVIGGTPVGNRPISNIPAPDKFNQPNAVPFNAGHASHWVGSQFRNIMQAPKTITSSIVSGIKSMGINK